MNRAIMNLDKASLDKIHTYSLDLLQSTGIRFPSEKALAIFKEHGFKVDGSMVYFDEKDIQRALETVPAAFTIEARNPSRNIRIGETNYVMAPGYGPPFIIEPSGKKRDALRADVELFCKLVQTSKYLETSTLQIFDKFNLSVLARYEERVIDALRENGPMTSRELCRKLNLSTGEVKRIVAPLEESNVIASLKEGNGGPGRPTTRYYIVE